MCIKSLLRELLGLEETRGDKLSIPAFTSLIVLVGVVVKNAIVLVDYTNQLRDRGVAMADALRAAGERRLRPVLMTAAAAVMGMVPLAITGA